MDYRRKLQKHFSNSLTKSRCDYLLVGLVGVTIDAHQKFALKYAIIAVIVMTAVAVAVGAISLF
ncbi:hypothetical protein A3863_21575 [Priestia endophytica]|uniref:Uncharacterized protein n=1 Tax=Priestia endophytica TaxID=135735 RepID=A0AAX1QBW8_9BACI|nr:hypothetical protein A3864_07875 [Priestia endophytica]RAS85517.1 hypothetical protein A3863_21575 [Priestia endophytica]